MSSIVTRGLMPKLMRPGLNMLFGEAYEALPNQWSMLYEHSVSHLNYEEDMQIVTMGPAQTKNEGGSIIYDDIKQGYPARYQHTTFGLGFIVTWEQVED